MPDSKFDNSSTFPNITLKKTNKKFTSKHNQLSIILNSLFQWAINKQTHLAKITISELLITIHQNHYHPSLHLLHCQSVCYRQQLDHLNICSCYHTVGLLTNSLLLEILIIGPSSFVVSSPASSCLSEKRQLCRKKYLAENVFLQIVHFF